MSKKLLSLFSGCGGMDLGFDGGFKVHKDLVNSLINPNWILETHNNQVLLSKNNFDLVFANDIVKAAKNAWVSYFGQRGISPSVFHLDSIVNLVKDSELGKFSFPSNIDIVTGGFPCQDFSVAGKRKGFNSHKSHSGDLLDKSEISENRGQLYQWMKKVIEITAPKVFIAENVKGLISLANAKSIIESDFKSIGEYGYIVFAKVLFAPDYGIPQRRERIFFIGLNKQYLRPEAVIALQQELIPARLDPFPPKTHTATATQGSLFSSLLPLKPYTTVRSVLESLNEPEQEKQDLAQMKYSKAKHCGNHQGQIEVNLDGLSPTIRSEHHGNIEYRRLSLEHGGRYIDELNKGLSERRLTVRECARIQTFPDDYEFVRESKDELQLGASSSYKLIGNAVPPFLAYHFAKRLELIWDKLFITDNLIVNQRKDLVLPKICLTSVS
ncbi:DNA-methyltransferase Dcm [Synechococcus sp. PCC 7502]|uniref:DNA cytosine methyltransferase n=1 Tax=Synechococcus sp. PCC 7502 TaxID=1173263 RepID=UPI00029FF8BD|nr:DNA (cytosine-5-)-methyltransferase [Synechococcus sp. PCC 7502]AFY73230.1 DNA-methyltransferase Dcm [Synechococcus sp. PCC 7502]